MFEKIKQRVRITTSALDTEIEDLIEEAKADLSLSGILADKIVDDDPLILRAVSTYCRAYYEADNQKSERLSRAYELIKTHLAMSLDYAVEPESEE